MGKIFIFTSHKDKEKWEMISQTYEKGMIAFECVEKKLIKH
jgi:hypothetical protein